MDKFIEIIKAIVFGIIEGITEWLPISSTGHMIILNQFFGFEATQGKAFYDFFLVIVQLGAIFAVIFSFFKELWPFGKNKSKKEKKEIWQTWLKIILASIPAGIIGIAFNDTIDKYLYNYVTVSVTLIVYGIAFLLIEGLLKKKSQKIQKRYSLNDSEQTYHDDDDDERTYPVFRISSVKDISLQYAFIIGLAQCLALIPGTSRSGVTICAALLLSIDRATSSKFSFYLSIPAMLGGSLVKAASYAINVSKGKADPITSFQIVLIVIAMLVAFAVSLLVINFFMKLIRSRTFVGFGIYRIVLGIVLLIVFFAANKGQLDVMNAIAPIFNANANLPKLSVKPNLFKLAA